MLEDVKAGRTNCIIVKDLSRFGRNYLDAGEYIEKIFPFLGVRFIAVNDNYDSLGGKNASDELVIPFKNLINEAYCRDISVKVRTQLEVKRKSGQYIGAFAVYGYLKDDADKNHLIVDEYAADIVRDIFSWKLEGMSPQDIAARLNRNGVLSPMEYKKSLGMKFATSFKANPQALWSANAVLRILKNPVYTGVLIQGRETTPSYKVRKRVTKPENEWAIVSDAHEAIIEHRDFDSVQKALLLDTRRSPGDSAVRLFSGMVFCGECGASMVRKTVPSGKKKYAYYICAAHKQDKSCSPHRMRDEALADIVLETLRQYIRDVVDLDDILAMTDTAPLRTAEAQKVQRQLDKKRSEYERLQKLLMSLYESLADGIIDRDEYARLKQNYAGRCAECEKQMDALQETLTQIGEHGGGHREWMAQFRKHLNITELERSIVVALIDRILIYRDIVGSTHTVKISRNDWVIVPDRHEAIVPEALFEKAQTCMREYREREVMTSGGNPLKRKVICGVCGHAIQRDNKKNGSYRCVMKRLNTGFDCSEDRIPEPDILEAVIDTIQVYAQYAVSIDRLLQTRQEQRQLDRKQAQRQLQTLQSRKARLDKRLQDLYCKLISTDLEIRIKLTPSISSNSYSRLPLSKRFVRV